VGGSPENEEKNKGRKTKLKDFFYEKEERNGGEGGTRQRSKRKGRFQGKGSKGLLALKLEKGREGTKTIRFREGEGKGVDIAESI